MLSEEFVSATGGLSPSSNTATAKHVGVHTHTLSPVHSVKSSFKNSSAPVNCLAVSETHIFAAQQEKAYVHVYSRLQGHQEAFVSFPERICCLALAGDVLVAGTAEGRVMLWEVCTGRLVSTPARHVQAVTCVAVTPYHVLTGSDDSDVHVWSLAHLLRSYRAGTDYEPERSLSNHRGGITALAVTPGANPNSTFCVSASRDKSCIVWNYQSGDVLRTVLFPGAPLCLSLDPAARALFVSADDGSLFLIDFFGPSPVLGPRAEDAATVVQKSIPFGVAPPDAGPAACLSVSYDGTLVLTGHPRGQVLRWDVSGNTSPMELANLNAPVTNLVFTPPLPSAGDEEKWKRTQVVTVVKPSQAEHNYKLATRLDGDLPAETTRFASLSNAVSFPREALETAVLALSRPVAEESVGEQELKRQNEELWEIINEQRALQKQQVQRCLENHRS